MTPEIYFDNAATTPVEKTISEALLKLLENQYYNADSLYDNAIKLKQQIEKSRQAVAALLGAKAAELIFTSGASEGNNQIIRGLVDYYGNKRPHLITTTVEHSSVKEVFDYYENQGFRVDRIAVNQKGELDFQQLATCLKKDTLLVSIMAVNNEVGTIFPVNELAHYVKENSRAFFHSDMTQALAKVPVSLDNIDFASFSLHKIGGLKGSGFIYKRWGTNLIPLIMGGQQEFNQRAGTSNAPYQLLAAKTLDLALKQDQNQIKGLAETLVVGLQKIAAVKINSAHATPYIVNFSLDNISSQVAINALANKGIMVSGQSTCSTKKYEYSLVLKNMGFPEKFCRNSLRVSFWHQNTIKEVEIFLRCLQEVISSYGL